MEVRRNPARFARKDTERNYFRPRKRLLSAEGPESMEPNKRAKLATMPYMNTRSVTRKMYNVGATYQAPTLKDETEWKEWPVHGMHERPVFHSQVGLAVEYLGKYYTSPDGLSYREVFDQPEIEIVSVDPHKLPSGQRKRGRKAASKTRESSDSKVKKECCFSKENKSFKTCMHGTLHCVLGYSSQVMTPTYKKSVEGKLKKSKDESTGSVDAKEFNTEVKKQERGRSYGSLENMKPEKEKNFKEYAVAVSQGGQSISQTDKCCSPVNKVYHIEPQTGSFSFANLKALQSGTMKVHDIRAAKNSFIFLKPTDAKSGFYTATSRNSIFKPIPNDVSVTKVENTANNETSTETFSLYKNLSNKSTPSCKSSPKDTCQKKTPTRSASKPLEYTVTKCLFTDKREQESQKKENDRSVHYQMKSKEIPNSKVRTGNETSEIARILSEYNRSSAGTSTISQMYTVTSSNTKPNILRTTGKAECWNKKETHENFTERNIDIKFPQGKWRRFHFTVEKIKDAKAVNTSVGSSVPEKEQPKHEEQKSGLSLKISDTQVNSQIPCKRTDILHASKTNVNEKGNATNAEEHLKVQSLQELLENTAILYCAATGVHQDDLVNYINTLDTKQSIQWLESWNKLIE